MESKSFLLSFFDIYKGVCIQNVSLQTDFIEIEFYLEMYKNKAQTLKINFDKIPGFYHYSINIVTAQSLILNLKLDCSSLLLCIANLCIQELIKTSIDYSSIKNGKLYYTFYHKEVCIELPSKPIVEVTYNNLILCSMLSQGYKIKEVKGSHFLFISSQLSQNMVTTHSCTCDTFSVYRDCKHLRSSRSVASNRNKLSGVLEVV